jgi:hypothetical protein
MTTKIDLKSIFVDYIRTLKSAKTDKYELVDISVFVFIPIIIGALCCAKGITFDKDAIGILVSALSILAGLFDKRPRFDVHRGTRWTD